MMADDDPPEHSGVLEKRGKDGVFSGDVFKRSPPVLIDVTVNVQAHGPGGNLCLVVVCSLTRTTRLVPPRLSRHTFLKSQV